MSERIHFVGAVDDERLADCYRAADVFVMPSSHEGFCIPVLEAMACGLPVIAARSAALPETVGDAGLTFSPHDVEDLAGPDKTHPQLVPRLCLGTRTTALEALTPVQEPSELLVRARSDAEPRGQRVPRQSLGTIALVSFRYGAEIVGGAETSLRTIARALQRNGRPVEIFATCTRAEGDWANELPAGSAPCAKTV